MLKSLIHKLVGVRKQLAKDLGEDGDMEKPFIEHLEDLRKMVVRSAIALTVSTILCFAFYQPLLDLLMLPKKWANVPINLTTIAVTEGFMVSLRVSFIAGFVVAFPFIMFFILQFVLPGLRRMEKRILWPAIAIGLGLFLIGASFAYFIIIPKMLVFFYEWNRDLGIASEWRIADYIKISSNFVLLSGLSFELPVLVMALVKLEILNFRVMNRNRSIAIIVIAAAAAAITPTSDLMSLLLLGGPMYFLYEVCIWLAWYMEKRDRELHPDLYKDLEDIEVKDDWDTEDFRPWEELAREEDETNEKRTDQVDEYHRPPAVPMKSDEETAPTGETPVTEKPAAPAGEPEGSEPGTGSDVESQIRSSDDSSTEPPSGEDPKDGNTAGPAGEEPPKP
jgi:sec-independent protein translocase protein TatC